MRRAARPLEVVAGRLRAEDISEQTLAPFFCLADLPPVDLFIRTGGEQRISNFLLWQVAYAELYFTDALWPDVDADVLAGALAEFARRERRYGSISAQSAGRRADDAEAAHDHRARSRAARRRDGPAAADASDRAHWPQWSCWSRLWEWTRMAGIRLAAGALGRRRDRRPRVAFAVARCATSRWPGR